MEVSRVSERSLKGVSGKFQWCFRKYQRSLKEVSRVFKENFKGISRKFQACFKGDFSGFQGYLKELQRQLQGKYFKGVTRKLQGCSKRVFRKL